MQRAGSSELSCRPWPGYTAKQLPILVDWSPHQRSPIPAQHPGDRGPKRRSFWRNSAQYKEANRAGRLTEEFYLALTQQQQIRRIVLKTAVEEWLTECKGSTAAGTLRRYREIAKAFLSFLKAGDGRLFLNDITAEEIRSFLVTVRADRAAKTVNLYRGALYTFFSRALQNGLLKANPVMAV